MEGLIRTLRKESSLLEANGRLGFGSRERGMGYLTRMLSSTRSGDCMFCANFDCKLKSIKVKVGAVTSACPI